MLDLLPGYREIPASTWADPRWQSRNAVTSVAELAHVAGARIPPAILRDIAEDQARHAGMSLRLTPHWLSLFQWDDLSSCPLRRYTLPLASERAHPPDHPLTRIDSLEEELASPAPGLLMRYPSTALVLLAGTCPNYCAHCSRMRAVGPPTPQQPKKPADLRHPHERQALLQTLRALPGLHDVLLSGGDLASIPVKGLEPFIGSLLEIQGIREIRLATKALVTLPQLLLRPAWLDMIHRSATVGRSRGIRISIQTQINHPRALSGATVAASRALLEAGVAEIRNQAVLLRGVNDDAMTLLDLHRRIWIEAGITPYYVFLCELLPGAEHWRIPVNRALELEAAMVGQLPGYATPRFMVDLPGLGKRALLARNAFDPAQGMSWWEGVSPMDGRSMRVGYPDPLT